MPLTIPAGDGIATFRLRYDNDSEEMVTTLGVRALSAPLGADHALRLRSIWATRIQPQLLITVTFLGVVLRVRQDGGGDQVYESNPTSPVAGATSGSGFPPNTAVLVEKITGRAGRRGRGRMFIPGINDTQADNAGNVAAANITSWNNALSGFLADLQADPGAAGTGAAVRPLLFHGNTTSTDRSTSGGVTTITRTVGAAGPGPDFITQLTLDPKLATQRRRMR